MKKLLVGSLISVTLLSLVVGCSSLDVVGKAALKSFEAFADASKGNFVLDATQKAWVLQSPNAERFLMSVDSALGKADVALEFSAAQFIEAGLDTAKLPSNYAFDAVTNTLRVTADLGDVAYAPSNTTTPQATFGELVKAYRPSVGYHKALDHYGIDLGGGNMFEWAKDLKTNDKDMVFVLNPEPFIKAGVDPTKVIGWAFLKIPVMDAAGKPQEVDKFVMPYEILK